MSYLLQTLQIDRLGRDSYLGSAVRVYSCEHPKPAYRDNKMETIVRNKGIGILTIRKRAKEYLDY